jgi:hypothetical protein
VFIMHATAAAPAPPPPRARTPRTPPHLHRDELVVDLDLLGEEVGADGGLVLL